MMTAAAVKTEEKKNGAKKAEAKPKTREKTGPSTAKEPVKLARELFESMKNARRKDIIAACVAKGINRWTASTQLQLWRHPKKAKKS